MHRCALLCAHCRFLPLIVVDLAPGTFTTVICMSDRPINPSDHHVGELLEGKTIWEHCGFHSEAIFNLFECF